MLKVPISIKALAKELSGEKQASFNLVNTQTLHMQGQSTTSLDHLLFRTPLQPSVDGNTVEDQIEHAEYMKNTLAFQSSFQFLNSKFQGLRSAIRGD